MHSKWRWWLLMMHTVAAVSPVIKIGAIFTEETRGGSAELAFKYAVYRINKERSILPESTIVYDIQYIPPRDTFKAYKKACALVQSGAVTIFTIGGDASAVVSALSRTLRVPHLDVSPVDLGENQTNSYTINMHPSRAWMDRAFTNLTGYLNWTRMGVIYEDYGYGELNIANIGKDGRDMVAIRCSNPHQYRHALTLFKAQGITNFIVDTDRRELHRLFRAILQLQMNNEDHHYIFTSFDIELFDMEDFLYNRVNMSGWRLVDRDSDRVKDALQLMEKFHPIGTSILSGGHIKTYTALLYDAVQVVAIALSAMKHSTPHNVSCDHDSHWQDGQLLRDNINKVVAHGLTGPIEFQNGVRQNFKLQLMRLVGGENGGTAVTGTWTHGTGLEVTDPAAYTSNPPPNVTLTVVTVEEKPYVMIKEGWNLQGNERFEGFCIDLLAKVAARAGFNYRLRLVPGNVYGARDPDTGEWNGIVRELMDRKADIAVASMTINYARESVIDFTKPFMNLGIGILFKVPTSQPTRLFSFLNPLAVEIWLYVLAAYILVSFTLFVMARFSPYEWSHKDMRSCSHNLKIPINQFTVCNSIWFITGTFLRQGSGLNPKATSTRVVGGIWWFFTLIILSSYTANLAAFLTVERTILPIQSAADLANQNAIPYGTLDGGSTMTFFRDSNIDIYKKMWQHMSTASPPALVTSYEEGVRRVLAGNYAFLMESTMLDHRVQRDCNLTQLGGLLDSKGYGIATYKNSAWRDKISLAILELQEKGAIQILYDKWWKNTGDVCNREGKDSKANPLGVQHIGGVFVTLVCGLVLAILVSVLEFCWHTKRTASHHRQSLCSEVGHGLRTAVRGETNCRTTLTCPRCSPSTHVPPPSRYNEIVPAAGIELSERGVW